MAPTLPTTQMMKRCVEYCKHIKCSELSKTGSGYNICSAFVCRESMKKYRLFMVSIGMDPNTNPDKEYDKQFDK